ncbi:MAG: glycerol-3-phosphate dehydrogenase (NAD(P)+) [Verrucomicrobiales bacterium]|jgi:glycerol-3-phosphate dehydrogenase (NAD(P)+)
MIEKACVIGGGSWGTALAATIAKRGIDVTLWARDRSAVDAINAEHENARYLPGVALPESLVASADLATSIAGCGLILFVVPSGAMRSMAEQVAAIGVAPGTILVNCTKGIERNTGLRMSEVIGEALPDSPCAVLSGPNHAEEVARELATAAVIGCEDGDVAVRLQEVFTLPWFRTYTSDDVAGIEIGSAVKNVFAIAAGICDGLGLGDNAKAALVTRGLAEMVRIGKATGGKQETFQGLSGVGDLIVTCYSTHSRNNRVGRLLGEGMSLEKVESEMNMVAEGVANSVSLYECVKKLGIEAPIIEQAYRVIHDDKPPAQALSELLSRDPRPEVDEA